MQAEIISIGTEILLDDIVNTNAQFLSEQLALLGIDIFKQQVIGDNKSRLFKAIQEAFEQCDLIITTGGLGATQDDITKEVAAKYFNKELVKDEETYSLLKKYFNEQEAELADNNLKQAYFPKGAKILLNECGTAPGAIITENNKVMIILPGPPKEMQSMFKKYIVPYLLELTDMVIRSKTLRVFGISESNMAEKLNELIENSKNPTVAPYVKDVDVILRITAKAQTAEECYDLISPMEKKIKSILGEKVYGEGEATLEHIVAEMLCSNNLTVSTAESCTGGMIAAKLISYPGVSASFIEGAVTYSNEAKMKRLGVGKDTLKNYGAVSEETAREMAIGICKASGSNVSIVSTGIAGPGGGTSEKPVGLVYIGVALNGNVIVQKCNFKGDRDKVRTKATMSALNLLRLELIKNGYK